MILIDVNLLLYAHDSSSPAHKRAVSWLDEQLNGTSRIGIAWATLLSFVRLTTNPKMYHDSNSLEEAIAVIKNWLSCPLVWIPQPTERHFELIAGFAADTSVYGNLVMDAHLAALAIEHGLTVCTNDTDFARFPGVKWMNPLLKA